LLERWSSADLSEEIAFDQLEPLSDPWLINALNIAYTGQFSQPVAPVEFLPESMRPKAKPQTPKAIMSSLRDIYKKKQ
jgi:hypothetical protein